MLRCRHHWLTIVTLLAVLSLSLLAEEVPPDIKQAIDDLSSDVFLTREKASEKLLAAGAVAIAPLEGAAARGELETTARALAVLEQLAVDSKEESVRDAALTAAQRLSVSELPRVAARAGALVEAIAELRRTQAIAHLVGLGATFSDGPQLTTTGILPHLLEIGPAWRGEDDDLRVLNAIFDLQAVSLSGDQATDAWVERLTAIPALTYLKLKKTKVTARGIERLKLCKDLTAIDFLYFPVDDEAIRPLAGMRQLSAIRLYGTKVSKEGAAKLAFDLPTTKVDVRRGGFLGIGIEPHPLGCIITRVEAKSMAARAGLEPGDVILSISGEKPGSFEELTKLIGRFEPGEELSLQLYRDGERETLKVKLGEWE